MKLTFRIFTLLATLAILVFSCAREKNGMGESLASITLPSVEFTIDAGADTTIFGKQGTRIFIEKETFQFADGRPVTGPVKIELKEFYDKSDMVLADLATASNGRMLETGGMLNIAATSEGQDVEIRGDKRIVVHFPKTKGILSEEMNLFYAADASTDSAVTNWDIDTVDLVKKTLEIRHWGWYHPEIGDSTEYNFIPKDLPKDEYYVNPLDLYLNAYNFAPATRKEIESNLNHSQYRNFASWNTYGIECEMGISKEGWVQNPRVNSKVSPATRKEIINFLQNMPQLEPGKNKHGEIIARRGLLFLQGGAIVPLYETREAYLKSFDKKYASLEKSPIKNVNDAELEYYIFSVAKLGWINCDRFWDANNPVDFVVQAPVDQDTKVKLVFSAIDGVLMPNIVDGKYVFSKVPMGGEATIVALNNSGGNLQAAFRKVTISDKPVQDLAFKEMTMAELKEELGKLN